ncbi:hypothetical protein ABK040_000769 [Willaertia magna]
MSLHLTSKINLFHSHLSKEMKEYLVKWDLQDDQVQYVGFKVDYPGNSKEENSFILKQKQTIKLLSEQALCLFNKSGKLEIEEIKALKTTCTDMSCIKDILLSNEKWIHTKTLNLKKCFDEQIYGNFFVSDEYRKALCNILWAEDSSQQCYSSFNDIDDDSITIDSPEIQALKEEFLFHIHAIVAIGGPLTQYEDNAKPYYEVTKQLYKLFVSCKKGESPTTTNIATRFITSKVYQVKFKQNGYLTNHNFFYLIIEPNNHTIKIWSNLSNY